METPQQSLFHEAIEDAIGADVAALGGPKKVGAALFPHLSLDQAGAMLRACMNAERHEKLSPGQLLLLKKMAREVGSHAVVTFEAQQLGYRVEWVDPRDEADELRREVRDLLKAVTARLERIERAEQRVVPLTGARR